MKKILSKKGFTLVEMLIVVVIIGILAAALIPKLTGAQARARDTARKANLNQALAGIKVYESDNGIFPGTGGITRSLEDLRDLLVPGYLNSIPADPQSSKTIQIVNGSNVTGGAFAYSPLTRAGTQYGGMVLGANIESEGRNANWVVLGDSPDNSVGGNVPTSVNTATIKLTSVGLLTVDTTVAGTTESIELQKTICNKVDLTKDSTTTATMADPDACLATGDNSMLYLLIQ